MNESDEILRIPLDAMTRMKQLNPGHHLCNIVQGLIENSIDSQCSQISIFIENDGLSSIKIIDDGHGIPRDSMPSVCRFHFTSKIKEITPAHINHGRSFGFTGSFLANLSCVSQVKVTSRHKSEEKAYFGQYEYNSMTKSGESFDLECGTRVEVFNFLCNQPSQRLKILKNQKELNKMIDTIVKYSIVYSWIKFDFYLNDNLFHHTLGNSDFFTNLYSIHNFTEPYKSFQVLSMNKIGNTEVVLFLSNPRFSYLSPGSVANSRINFLRGIFLNGRLVSIPAIKKEINKIYQEFSQTMGNYYVKNPYFIFIRTSESEMNDCFNDDFCELESETIDLCCGDSNLNLDAESKCYYQKNRHFDFSEKVVQECISVINEPRVMPNEFIFVKEVRRLEGILIEDHLCVPPKINEASRLLFPLPAQPPPKPLQPLQQPSGPIAVMPGIISPPLQQNQSQQFAPTARIIPQPTKIVKRATPNSPIVIQPSQPSPAISNVILTPDDGDKAKLQRAASTSEVVGQQPRIAQINQQQATMPIVRNNSAQNSQKMPPKMADINELLSGGQTKSSSVVKNVQTAQQSTAQNSPAVSGSQSSARIRKIVLAPPSAPSNPNNPSSSNQPAADD